MTRLASFLLVVVMVASAPVAFAEEPVSGRAVDLNAATFEELCTLPGVGPKKANAILELRKRRPFTRVTQLLEVRGIGRKRLEKIRPHVRIPQSGGQFQAPAQTR